MMTCPAPVSPSISPRACGQPPHPGQQSASRQANQLTAHLARIPPAPSDLEHLKMRPAMGPCPGLTQDVGPLKQAKRFIEVADGQGALCGRSLAFESLATHLSFHQTCPIRGAASATSA